MLDPSSPEAKRAAERARDLITARLCERATFELGFTLTLHDLLDELQQGDENQIGSVLGTQLSAFAHVGAWLVSTLALEWQQTPKDVMDTLQGIQEETGAYL